MWMFTITVSISIIAFFFLYLGNKPHFDKENKFDGCIYKFEFKEQNRIKDICKYQNDWKGTLCWKVLYLH